MSILPIIIAPDPVLKQKSALVTTVDDAIRAKLNDMVDTMYAMNGIGLAGVQVGILQKLIVVDVEWRKGARDSRSPLKFINAEIISDSEEDSVYEEGCLSFPDQYAQVIRPKEITVRYLDTEGNEKELFAEGLLATCLQHEIDHTNGITFVDHITRLKRDMIHKKLEKQKKQGHFDHVHDEHCNH